MFIAALLTKAKTQKQPKRPSQRNKEDAAHIRNGILPVISKKEIMPFAETWVDLEIIILSDIQNKYDITYMWN